MIAVDVTGDRGYLETHPSTVHLGAGRDGRVVVWLDEAEGDGPNLDPARPDRPPEVELHGEGAPPSALLQHPRAQHAEVFFDALGDPQAAPLGWWHARIWLRPA